MPARLKPGGWAGAIAAEARALGHGGIRVAARAAGMREGTVSRGVAELESGEGPLGRARRRRGGRKRAADLDPGLRPALLAPGGAGYAEQSDVAVAVDHQVDAGAGGRADRPGARGQRRHRRRPAPREGFSLQGNAKTIEGKQQEISRMEQIPLGTAKTRIRTALLRLRSTLAEEARQ